MLAQESDEESFAKDHVGSTLDSAVAQAAKPDSPLRSQLKPDSPLMRRLAAFGARRPAPTVEDIVAGL